MAEVWEVPPAYMRSYAWPEARVRAEARDIGNGRKLVEFVLKANEAAWNPASRKLAIQGPAAVQYVISQHSIQPALFQPGECLGSVRHRNELARCPVKGLAPGLTRCPEHETPGMGVAG